MYSTNRKDFIRLTSGSLIACSTSGASLAVVRKTSDRYKNIIKAGAKSTIFIFIRGGISHIDSFDVKDGIKDNPTRAIKTSADGVRVSAFFPCLAQQMHHVAVINSMVSDQGAHKQGQYLVSTGHRKRSADLVHPNLGAWVSRFLPRLGNDLPNYVKINHISSSLGSGFFEGKYGALPIGKPSMGLPYARRSSYVLDSQYKRRLAFLSKMNDRFEFRNQHQVVKDHCDAHENALRLIESDDVVAFDVNTEPMVSKERYGKGEFAMGCLLARRLVEKGVRFIELGTAQADWDHHSKIYNNFSDQCREIDRPIAVLLDDLHQRGLLSTTQVVLATEFGRSPRLNKNDGRDHYGQAFSTLIAGAGVQGGQCYGRTDRFGAGVIDNEVRLPDLNATIAAQMGIDPFLSVDGPFQKKYKVTERGKPILKIF